MSDLSTKLEPVSTNPGRARAKRSQLLARAGFLALETQEVLEFQSAMGGREIWKVLDKSKDPLLERISP
jgi:hypothetical protein